MLVLGVVTKASSHPVGSKSFAGPALESNGVLPAFYHNIRQNIDEFKKTKNKCYQKHLPDGTIAKARALFSSITDASAEMEFKPCTSHKNKSSGIYSRFKIQGEISYR